MAEVEHVPAARSILGEGHYGALMSKRCIGSISRAVWCIDTIQPRGNTNRLTSDCQWGPWVYAPPGDW